MKFDNLATKYLFNPTVNILIILTALASGVSQLAAEDIGETLRHDKALPDSIKTENSNRSEAFSSRAFPGEFKANLIKSELQPSSPKSSKLLPDDFSISNSKPHDLLALSSSSSDIIAKPNISGSSKETDDALLRLSREEFLYADNPRFLIDGSTPYKETHINTLTTTVLSGAILGIFAVQHEMQQNTIWKKTDKFWIAEDGPYSHYQDKCGHFFGTYMSSYVFGEIFMETGFDRESSNLIGGLLGWSYTTYVEIFDGCSRDFGFSPTDWYADIAGASFYIAQYYVPFLENFTPKFMYVPGSWHREKSRAEAETFIDNYSTQTFYVSMNIHNMLPDNLKKYWPNWLELAVGRAVYSLSSNANGADLISNDPHYGKVYGNTKYMISLEPNLVKLLPEGPGFWNWIRQGMQFLKLPTPTLEIGSNTKFFLSYPFFIDIGSVRL